MSISTVSRQVLRKIACACLATALCLTPAYASEDTPADTADNPVQDPVEDPSDIAAEDGEISEYGTASGFRIDRNKIFPDLSDFIKEGVHYSRAGVAITPVRISRKQRDQRGQIRIVAPVGQKICRYDWMIFDMNPNEPHNPKRINVVQTSETTLMVHYDLPAEGGFFIGGFTGGQKRSWLKMDVVMNVLPTQESC